MNINSRLEHLGVQPVLILLFLMATLAVPLKSQTTGPMKIGIAGLSHDHVHGILRQLDRKDFVVVGISEADPILTKRLRDQYGFDPDLVYSSLEQMLDHASPDAVLGFGSTHAHLEVVQKCAPRGIHVMVEKPLAVNLEHARSMQKLVLEHGIHLLVNYETTWYPSNQHVKKLVEADALGEIRKIVVHDGHEGPREIGCSEEFLAWLTDPVLNGGGALTDFGCYGANLITWLMNGERPIAVTGITQTIKPTIYPEVDDEATIILKYPGAQGIIQASWNWPFSRKDMEVYGRTGFIFADNHKDIRTRLASEDGFQQDTLVDLKKPFQEPFGYFIKVIRKKIEMDRYSPSSLENNLIVTEILDAARTSAASGKVVNLELRSGEK